MKFGYSEGEVCNRDNCKGIIEIEEVENCSCHVSPPCSACTSPRAYCPICDYHSKNDFKFNDYIVNKLPQKEIYKCYELRELDKSKIDWHSFPHTHFSMIMRGVYPEGFSREDVIKKLDAGTFGGRFNYFGNGKFEYVAYTD